MREKRKSATAFVYQKQAEIGGPAPENKPAKIAICKFMQLESNKATSKLHLQHCKLQRQRSRTQKTMTVN